MPERSVEENQRASMARIALLAMGMQDFATLVVRHVLSGNALDDASFAVLKATAIENLKNAETTGLPIGDEAEAFRESIGDLDRWIDQVIERGRDGVAG